MRIKPLNKNVLIQPDSGGEKVTEGGLYIPEVSESEPVTGIVMAVADDVTQLKVGDHVQFRKFAGEPVEHTILMLEDDVLLVFEE